MIRAGRVTVDGRPAVIGEQVDPQVEIIGLDGRLLPEAPRSHSYWALNKPAGVVSTVRDRHAFRTVLDVLPPEAKSARVYPVGRLDEMSEGLLLLTDDGTWADLLLHPRYEVEREYVVGLERAITKAQKAALQGQPGHSPIQQARIAEAVAQSTSGLSPYGALATRAGSVQGNDKADWVGPRIAGVAVGSHAVQDTVAGPEAGAVCPNLPFGYSSPVSR